MNKQMMNRLQQQAALSQTLEGLCWSSNGDWRNDSGEDRTGIIPELEPEQELEF